MLPTITRLRFAIGANSGNSLSLQKTGPSPLAIGKAYQFEEETYRMLAWDTVS